MTQRSRRFSGTIGCFCGDRLGNNGNIHIVQAVFVSTAHTPVFQYFVTNRGILTDAHAAKNIELSSNKTKDFIKLLEDLKVTGKTLIVVKELTDNLILASRNLSNVKVIESHEINTYDVLNYNNVVITEEAVKMLEEVLR